MYFTIPTITVLALTTSALAASGDSHPEYSNKLSPSHSSHAAITTPIPTNSHSSSKVVNPSTTSAVPSKSSSVVPSKSSSVVPSKSSSAVQPSKTATGGGSSGNGGSGSGSGSGEEGEGEGSEGGEGGEGSVPPFVPGNPGARIDAHEATFLGAALGALGAFAALV